MIIVFGSNILDQFFELESLDIFTNPKGEDALHLQAHTEAPGGKGANQAVAAAKAGADVRFFGAVGDGGHGRQLIQNFKDIGINTDGILLTDLPTGVAAIMNLPGGKHKIIVSQGANTLAKQSQVPDALLTPSAICLLQAEMNRTENETLMKRAKEKGARIILNLAPANPISGDALACVDYFILNEPEAATAAKALGLSYGNYEELCQKFATQFSLTCVITLGEKGAMACDHKSPNSLIFVPALKIKAVDSVGAGDAFCGAFAEAIDTGQSLEVALKRGSIAGALACTKVGAQVALPTKAEIDGKLPELGQISTKALAPSNARPEVERLRA